MSIRVPAEMRAELAAAWAESLGAPVELATDDDGARLDPQTGITFVVRSALTDAFCKIHLIFGDAIYVGGRYDRRVLEILGHSVVYALAGHQSTTARSIYSGSTAEPVRRTLESAREWLPEGVNFAVALELTGFGSHRAPTDVTWFAEACVIWLSELTPGFAPLNADIPRFQASGLGRTRSVIMRCAVAMWGIVLKGTATDALLGPVAASDRSPAAGLIAESIRRAMISGLKAGAACAVPPAPVRWDQATPDQFARVWSHRHAVGEPVDRQVQAVLGVLCAGGEPTSRDLTEAVRGGHEWWPFADWDGAGNASPWYTAARDATSCGSRTSPWVDGAVTRIDAPSGGKPGTNSLLAANPGWLGSTRLGRKAAR